MAQGFENELDVQQTVGYLNCNSYHGAVVASGLVKTCIAKFSDKAPQANEFKFDHFSPVIPMMYVSDQVPSDITEELFDSFKYYHFDPNSAAAKLRRAMEKFCESMGAKGSNLHRQIESLANTYPQEAEYLGALKLVGNEGAHSGGVAEPDLLLAYRVFQFVLELYDRQARYQEAVTDFDALQAKFNS